MSGLRLVPFADAHVEPFTRTLADPLILRFTGTPDPTPPGWVAQWRALGGPDRPRFAVLDAGDFVGYAVTMPIDREHREAELGYAVAPWARGRGVATETLRLLTAWAFADGIVRASLQIDVANTASSRVAENCGYTFEGVLRSVGTKNGLRADLQSWSRLPTDVSGSWV